MNRTEPTSNVPSWKPSMISWPAKITYCLEIIYNAEGSTKINKLYVEGCRNRYVRCQITPTFNILFFRLEKKKKTILIQGGV